MIFKLHTVSMNQSCLNKSYISGNYNIDFSVLCGINKPESIESVQSVLLYISLSTVVLNSRDRPKKRHPKIWHVKNPS